MPSHDAAKKEASVAWVAARKLCCSCGACEWICPEKAVALVETTGGYLLPTVDLSACTECGKCLSVCPGVGFAAGLADRLPEDPFAGACLQAFVGKATDPELYANSQSGGVVAALLAFALEKDDLCGGAITATMEHGRPPRPREALARSREDVLQSQKSKYSPVPLLKLLAEVELARKPVAIVGLPCHVHGLHNVLEGKPSLADRTGLVIGLFCDRVMTCAAIDHLVAEAGFAMDEDLLLHFRDKTCRGYPGDVRVFSNSRSVSLPPERRMRIKDYFTPARCRLCFDKWNVFADIAVGDPRGIAGVDNQGGESAVVLRTQEGARFFEEAMKAGYVTARPISYEDILSGQAIETKRLEWSGYVNAWRELGLPLPNYCDRIPSSAPVRPGAYRKRLSHSLALDAHLTREAMLASARRALGAEALLRMLALPVRIALRIVRGTIGFFAGTRGQA